MDLIFTISIIIAFITVCIILLIFLPKPTVFFDPYVSVTEFDDKFTEIKTEIENVNDTSPVIPIFGLGMIYDNRFPILYETLRSLPYVRYAGIINIKPKFEQVKQYGYNMVANSTIRYFYTIKQSATNKSGIWVDGAKKFFAEKQWICADVSRENSLFNKYKYDSTIVIFIDIDRNSSDGNSPNTSVEKDEILKLFYKGKYINAHNISDTS